MNKESMVTQANERAAIQRDGIAKALASTHAHRTAAQSEREGVLEQVRLAYKTGYSEAYEDCTGTVDNDASEEGWGQYLEANPALTTPAPAVSTEEIVAVLKHVRNGGPHEWGYRDITDGTFIADDWPFEAAAILSRIQGEGE